MTQEKRNILTQGYHMKLSDYNYQLPEALIAQEPTSPRDNSRLLVLHRATDQIEHRRFFNIIDYFKPGDVLVLNDSRVIPARLYGKKITGGVVEVFLSRMIETSSQAEQWLCMLSGKYLRPECEVWFSKNFKAVLKKRVGDFWEVEFNCSGKKLQRALEKYGETPLPPYIKKLKKKHKDQYQTVYSDSDHSGSVAAPTAGLHFTQKLIKQLKKKGVIIQTITLHIGLGTFAPIRVENIKEHQLHSEWIEVKKEVRELIELARSQGNKVYAVGTTTARALEASWSYSMDSDFQGWVNIFIYPPYRFNAIDCLITNFHLPQSSLLMLVSAFVGREKILKAYEEAIKEKYRFFSFGDAMLILE